jgi:hypothetical protein
VLFTQQFTVEPQSELTATNLLLLENLHALLIDWKLFHPLFAGSGLLIVYLCIPSKDSIATRWKWISLLFILGILVTGKIGEARIFYEMIPIALGELTRRGFF